jgi:hypothetical protein
MTFDWSFKTTEGIYHVFGIIIEVHSSEIVNSGMDFG